jgi:hypothetical protein
MLGGCAMAGETNAAPLRLELQSLTAPDAAMILSLALVADPAPSLVLAYGVLPAGRRLAVMALAGGAPAPITAIPHSAAWSAAPAGPGQLQIAATDNGSVGSGLTWSGPGGRHAFVNTHERFGVFDSPTFLRPARATPEAVAAVGLIGGKMSPVVFLPDGGDGFAAARPLPPRPGVALAVRLLRAGQGFLLTTLTFQPGSEPRRRTDDPDDEPLQGGVLECQRLTAGLQPDGPAWRPFAAQTVWELDAVAVGDQAVILASVASGLALATDPGPGPASSVLHAAFPEPLLSPAVVAEGAVLHIAALASAGTRRATVLVARTSLP